MRAEKEIREELQDLDKMRLKISQEMDEQPNALLRHLDATVLARVAAKMEALNWVLREELNEL